MCDSINGAEILNDTITIFEELSPRTLGMWEGGSWIKGKKNRRIVVKKKSSGREDKAGKKIAAKEIKIKRERIYLEHLLRCDDTE